MDDETVFMDEGPANLDYHYTPVTDANYPMNANMVYLNENQEACYREENGVFFEEFAGDKIFGYDEDFDVVDTQIRLETFPETRFLVPSRKLKYNPSPAIELTVDYDPSMSKPLPTHTYDMTMTIEMRVVRPKADTATGHIESEQVSHGLQNSQVIGDNPEIKLTPLPDKYFVRRATGTAASVGLQSYAAYCDKCMFCFRTKTAHSKHAALHDQPDPSQPFLPRTQINCPVDECEVRSDCIATLIEHCRSFHGHDELVFESVEFTDINQFKKWKSEMERLTSARFTRSSGKLNVFSKSTYFHCHQAGGTLSTKTVPNLRQRASKKMGKGCTAFFHIKEKEDGKVLLRGCVQHVGHETNPRNMPLSEEIKKEIAAYLLEGLDEHDIVELLRQQSSLDDRRHYVQPYEVRNVHTKLIKHRVSVAEAAADMTLDGGSSEDVVVVDVEDDNEGDDREIDVTTIQGTSASCQLGTKAEPDSLNYGHLSTFLTENVLKEEDMMEMKNFKRSFMSHRSEQPIGRGIIKRSKPIVTGEDGESNEIARKQRKKYKIREPKPATTIKKRRRRRGNATYTEPFSEPVDVEGPSELDSSSAEKKYVVANTKNVRSITGERFPSRVHRKIEQPQQQQQQPVTVIRPEPIRHDDPNLTVDFRSALTLAGVDTEESEGGPFTKAQLQNSLRRI